MTAAFADTPPVEKEIAFDIVKKAPIAAPFVIAGAGVLWGVHGAETAAVAVAVVCVNLVLAALSLAWAAKLGPTVLMGTALGGFLVRMGLVTVVVLAVRHQPWANLTALAVTILVTHLGLLAWETKYVSATLAYPGLAPKEQKR
ncbi:MAG: hypothetical protein QOE63_676 [Acidimicrobiaceae bacterium]|jgi:hypothetical protein